MPIAKANLLASKSKIDKKQKYIAAISEIEACLPKTDDLLEQITVILKKHLDFFDIAKFPEHIACDPRSKSEIAIPKLQRQCLGTRHWLFVF